MRSMLCKHPGTICFLTALFMVSLLTGGAWGSQEAVIGISCPGEVAPGDVFTLEVTVGGLRDFNAGNYDLVFDPLYLELLELGAGDLEGQELPVGMWNEVEPGRVRLIQDIPGVGGISGSGTLAVFTFKALEREGPVEVALKSGMLADTGAREIPATWEGGQVIITSEPWAGIPGEDEEGSPGENGEEGKETAPGDGDGPGPGDSPAQDGGDEVDGGNGIGVPGPGEGKGPAAVTGVSLDKAELYLYAGSHALLSARVVPREAENREVSWASSAPGIAGVDAGGRVAARSPGEVIITVTTSQGGFQASCRVVVIEDPYSEPFPRREGVSAEVRWNIGFSIPVDIGSLEGSVQVREGTGPRGREVPVEILNRGGEPGVVQVINLEGGYESGKTYTLYIGRGVRSPGGRYLREPVKFSFTIK